jgi:hypothetical protein
VGQARAHISANFGTKEGLALSEAAWGGFSSEDYRLCFISHKCLFNYVELFSGSSAFGRIIKRKFVNKKKSNTPWKVRGKEKG